MLERPHWFNKKFSLFSISFLKYYSLLPPPLFFRLLALGGRWRAHWNRNLLYLIRKDAIINITYNFIHNYVIFGLERISLSARQSQLFSLFSNACACVCGCVLYSKAGNTFDYYSINLYTKYNNKCVFFCFSPVPNALVCLVLISFLDFFSLLLLNVTCVCILI